MRPSFFSPYSPNLHSTIHSLPAFHSLFSSPHTHFSPPPLKLSSIYSIPLQHPPPHSSIPLSISLLFLLCNHLCFPLLPAFLPAPPPPPSFSPLLSPNLL